MSRRTKRAQRIVGLAERALDKARLAFAEARAARDAIQKESERAGQRWLDLAERSHTGTVGDLADHRAELDTVRDNIMRIEAEKRASERREQDMRNQMRAAQMKLDQLTFWVERLERLDREKAARLEQQATDAFALRRART